MPRLGILILGLLFAQTVGQPVPVISTVPLANFQPNVVFTAPDGIPALEVGYGRQISADLGVTPAQLQAYPPGQAPYTREGTYQLTFSVENYFPTYPGYYHVEVDYGTQELCETEGWGIRTFSTVTVTCPSPGYLIIDQAQPGGGPVQSANDLVIKITDTGWPVWLRNFSLTFTPSN